MPDTQRLMITGLVLDDGRVVDIQRDVLGTDDLPDLSAVIAAAAVTSFNGRNGTVTFVETDLPVVHSVVTPATAPILTATIDAYGRVTAFTTGTIGTSQLTDGAVTPAKMSNGTACSVLGRDANSSGVRADIAVTVDGGAAVLAFNDDDDAISWVAGVGFLYADAGGVYFSGDPGADRLVFWDDSAGTIAYLSIGSGLSITGTTLSASGGGGGLSDGDYGDVTVGGGGTTMTVDNDAITYAKIQNVSATSRILGRKSASAGDVEECTLSEVLDFIGSAAQGDILYRGASSWARLAAGTSGHYLKTQGSGANPTWAAVSASETWTVVKKTSDETISLDSTLSNDAALQFSMAASTNYHIRIKVNATSNTTGSFKYALTGPSSPTLVRVNRQEIIQPLFGTPTQNLGYDTSYTSSTSVTIVNTDVWIVFDIIVKNGSNTGTFAFQWAQNSSDLGNTTVRAGSYLEYMTF